MLVCISGRRGVIGFNLATSLRPVREKVRPARPGEDASAKEFAQRRAQKGTKLAFYGLWSGLVLWTGCFEGCWLLLVVWFLENVARNFHLVRFAVSIKRWNINVVISKVERVGRELRAKLGDL